MPGGVQATKTYHIHWRISKHRALTGAGDTESPAQRREPMQVALMIAGGECRICQTHGGYVSKFKLAERTAPTGSRTRHQARRVTMMMTSRPVIVCSPLFSTPPTISQRDTRRVLHSVPARCCDCSHLLPIGLSSVLRLFLALLTVLSVQRTSMPNAHLLISGYLRRSVEIYSLHPDSIIHHIHSCKVWTLADTLGAF